MPTRVIKLGGSLFDLPDLAPRFLRWRASQPAACDVVIAGGGKLADAVQDQRAARQWDDREVHWRCIEVMRTTARQLADLLPDATLIDGLLMSWETDGPGNPLVVLDCGEFLRRVEPTLAGNRLPENQRVTSDSIAARVAVALAGAELVLLKSALPPEFNREQASATGYVDRFFPQAAQPLATVRCVNLRDDQLRQCLLF